MVLKRGPTLLEQSEDPFKSAEDEKAGEATHDLRVKLHRAHLESGDGSNGIIVKLIPPQAPEDQDLSHIPCDVVLVIDVSSSMCSPAPLPTVKGQEAEATGLSVLDLVKHAAHTILETLDESDRLGIVTFDYNAEILQSLQPMTKENKAVAARNINSMKPKGITNLWKGILTGLDLFTGNEDSGRVPAVYVLTDGVPNHQCPPQGYVPKLRSKGRLPAAIHTFGFGYTLKSGLLKSIAEIGGGSYAFIPDAGMIGTVFVHAVANLQSTFATQAILRLTFPSSLLLSETIGERVDQEEIRSGQSNSNSLAIKIGNIQYGQSKDIYLEMKEASLSDKFKSLLLSEQPCNISALVQYSQMTSMTTTASDSGDLRRLGLLSAAETAYHISRSRICAFIASLIPTDALGEHTPKAYDPAFLTSLKTLIRSLPANAHASEPANASLLADLGKTSDLESGQVIIAVSKYEHFSRWGRHYLPSLADAHTRQACNTFKDPGPLQYGKDSALFIKCRQRLDDAFDALPAPEPSIPPMASARSRGANAGVASAGGWSRGESSMRSYHMASNPCFAGFCNVELADGRLVRLGKLKRGMEVLTPRGGRRVVALLKTKVRRAEMVKVGGLLVTPWHPVKMATRESGWLSLVLGNEGAGETGEWVFPAKKKDTTAIVRYTGSIYSVLLERDDDANAHAIKVGGVWGVTLGHGLTDASGKDSDVRAHAFLGNYDLVARNLASLGVGRDGIVHGGGVRRDGKTGRVCGFRRPGMTPQRQEDLRRTAGIILRKSSSF